MQLKQFCSLILIVFIVISCSRPEVSDNTRLVVKGRVVNADNQSLSDISVSTEAYIYDLGGDLTDGQGRFEFTSLASDAETFEIHINKVPSGFSDTTNTPYKKDFSSVSYIYNESEFQQTYALANTTLHKIAKLNFKVEKTSNSLDTLVGRLHYKRAKCVNFIGEDPPEYQNNGCYNTLSASLNLKPGSPDFENQFRTLLNSEAVFTYHINSEEEQTVTIPLNQTTNTYVFNY